MYENAAMRCCYTAASARPLGIARARVNTNAIGDALNGAMIEQPMKGADLPFINAVVLGFAQQ